MLWHWRAGFIWQDWRNAQPLPFGLSIADPAHRAAENRELSARDKPAHDTADTQAVMWHA